MSFLFPTLFLGTIQFLPSHVFKESTSPPIKKKNKNLFYHLKEPPLLPLSLTLTLFVLARKCRPSTFGLLALRSFILFLTVPVLSSVHLTYSFRGLEVPSQAVLSVPADSFVGSSALVSCHLPWIKPFAFRQGNPISFYQVPFYKSFSISRQGNIISIICYLVLCIVRTYSLFSV
ncbi:uncharacterized protein BJ212DRAFT_548759 [Suillus subaureus]|uniref:Uncharacterized protein n=1 Tax=Suillus subaureus TaxID=48587 RepID=A0A9P7EKY0_9AGAM|nr:uncharacterized protein BJ212DRAFT_548759 [Suillus subaureus]KAG1824826.1 hypothetical protein BJ212DRAFT_548759 [Suillus subaureus]